MLTKYLEYILLVTILLVGFFYRFTLIYPDNIIFGYDQARDMATARSITSDFDIKVIGPTAGNNPYLHHGVVYYYFLALVGLLSNLPITASLANSFVNLLAIVGVYLLAKSLTQKSSIALASAMMSTFSFYVVSFAGWLSNPSPTIAFVPFFFFFLWNYLSGNKRALVYTFVVYGLMLQLELFFLYLVPLLGVAILIKKDLLKNHTLIATVVFLLVVSTLIYAQLTHGINGITAPFKAGEFVGGNVGIIDRTGVFLSGFAQSVSYIVIPGNKFLSIWILVLGIIGSFIASIKTSRISAFLFLTIFLLSPLIVLFLGVHSTPWFFIGIPFAVIILLSWSFSLLGSQFLFWIATLIFLTVQLFSGKTVYDGIHLVLEPDEGAIISSQYDAVDYTYSLSGGKTFLINSVTNPLYINAVWDYHYTTYGIKRYGYSPIWIGGVQEYPFNKMPIIKSGEEMNLFVIMDETARIPDQYRREAVISASQFGRLKEAKLINGITVLYFSKE